MDDPIPSDPWVILDARNVFVACCATLEIAMRSLSISFGKMTEPVKFRRIHLSLCEATGPDGSEYEIRCVAMMHKADHV